MLFVAGELIEDTSLITVINPPVCIRNKGSFGQEKTRMGCDMV